MPIAKSKAMKKLLNREDINKIEHLDIDIFEDEQTKYDEARRKYIKDRTGPSWNWKKDRAEAEFDAEYPNTSEYISKNIKLTGSGEQQVIDKLNEVIDVVNKIMEELCL